MKLTAYLVRFIGIVGIIFMLGQATAHPHLPVRKYRVPPGHATTVEEIASSVIYWMIDIFERNCGWHLVKCSREKWIYKGEERMRGFECIFDVDTDASKRRRAKRIPCP